MGNDTYLLLCRWHRSLDTLDQLAAVEGGEEGEGSYSSP